MFVEQHLMPDDTRIWIYQADRELTSGEVGRIMELGKDFVDVWTAHKADLKASFEIRHKIFLLFYVDEKQASASGCSIDKSVHFIRKIEDDFAVSLLDRQLFAARLDGKIKILNRKEFEALLLEGKLNENSTVFNNLIQTKSDLKSKWEVRLGDSWHSAIKII